MLNAKLLPVNNNTFMGPLIIGTFEKRRPPPPPTTTKVPLFQYTVFIRISAQPRISAHLE